MKTQKTQVHVPPIGYGYCAGCSHEHKNSDFVQICIKCLQSKFIPRQDWLNVGFIDQKSPEQWWNHIKKLKIEELEKILAEQQSAAEKVRELWSKENPVEPDTDWGEEML